VLERRGEITNFASFLRVTCATYLALGERAPTAAAS